MAHDTAYEALIEDNDARWAFGTGFADAFESIDMTVPEEIDRADLGCYCLMLGDDALIMSHRLQQWCSHAPELEDEVALANIALDLLGQARLLLTRAGAAEDDGRDEDAYAFFRDEKDFRNVRLVEVDNGDFARSIARLFVFSTWRLEVLRALTSSRDPVLAAIAAKGVKELTYHREYAAGWVVRLGDGTERSHRRIQDGFVTIWPLVDELFVVHPVEERLVSAGVAADAGSLRGGFDAVVAEVCSAATIVVPDVRPLAGVAGRAGRHGVHTEAMGYLLGELQSVARAHPEATW